MSVLLDALRKSEAQRRAGELPALDLGAGLGVPGERPDAARHRQVGWMLVVVVLVIASLAIGWWRPWDPWPQPVQNEVPVGHGRATSASVEPTPPQAVGANASEATVALPSPAPPSSARAAPAAESGAPPKQPAPAPPTPIEPRPAVPDTAPDTVPDTAPNNDPRPEPKPGPTAEHTPETSAAVDPVPATEAAPAQAGADDLSLAGVIRPWELPESLRAEFPELRVSVHFYAARPADRFVLINGERRVEGSSLGGGVTLEEIRKRGVIVGFKRYRILIE